MRIYFLRHGQAAVRGEWGGADSERPLTETGVELMRREAEGMKRLGLGLEVIITSPYARAAQTADIVAERLDMRGRPMRDERLAPGFGPRLLAEILRENELAGAVLLVGHEPDFSETVGDLVGGARLVFKKGALARVDLPEHSVRRGDLVWLVPPGVLAV
jgi:phosphohistidine phosphatase